MEFQSNINYHQYVNIGRGYGHNPPRKVTATPLDEIAVNLIGPYKFKVKNIEYELFALTYIDPVINLV